MKPSAPVRVTIGHRAVEPRPHVGPLFRPAGRLLGPPYDWAAEPPTIPPPTRP